MAYTDFISSAGPFAYWPCQEPSGRTMTDVMGGKVLTWESDVTRGYSDSLVVGDTSTLGLFGYNQAASCLFAWNPSSYSVEWMVKPTAKYNYSCTLASSSSTTLGSSTWGRFAFHGSLSEPYCGTDTATRLVPSDFTDYGFSGFWTAGQWLHLTCTYESNVFRTYKNGQPARSGNVTAPDGPWPGLVLGGSTVQDNAWAGAVQHIALYPRRLSDAEIAQHYKETARNGVLAGGGYG